MVSDCLISKVKVGPNQVTLTPAHTKPVNARKSQQMTVTANQQRLSARESCDLSLTLNKTDMYVMDGSY